MHYATLMEHFFSWTGQTFLLITTSELLMLRRFFSREAVVSTSFSFMDQRAFFFTGLYQVIISSWIHRTFSRGAYETTRGTFFIDQPELFARRKPSDIFLHESANLFNVGGYRFVDFFVVRCYRLICNDWHTPNSSILLFILCKPLPETVEALSLILIAFSQLVKQWLVNSHQFNFILFFIVLEPKC